MDGPSAIERHSVGGYGPIGALYDARTDKLEGTNLFNKALPDTLMETIDMPHTDYEIDYNNSQKETFNKLNIEASLKLSLMAGLIDIGGSAKYLKQTKSDDRTVRITQICKIKTKQQHLQISRAELHEYFSPDALENKNATHVVTGILWGANVAATFEKVEENSDTVTEIEGTLAVKLKALFIDGNGKFNFDDKDKKLFESLKISFSGDVIPDHFSQTPEGVMKVFNEIPSLIKPINDGKGKPLVYTLYPLKRMAEIFKHDLQVNRLLREVTYEIIGRIEDIFEDINNGARKFNQFRDEVNTWKDYLCRQWKSEIAKKEAELTGKRLKTQRDLGDLLKKIRSDEAKEEEMTTLLDNFEEGNICSSMKIEQYLRDNRYIEAKLEILKSFGKNREDYLLTRFLSIEDILLKFKQKDVYLLHISNEWFIKNKQDSHKQLEYFHTLINKDKVADGKPSDKPDDKSSDKLSGKCAFKVIDYDLHKDDLEKDNDKADKCCIYFAKGGKIESKDFTNALKPELKWSSARWAQDGVTVAGGNGPGNGLNQLNSPHSVYVHDDDTIIIADQKNHRIVEWKQGATTGQVVAGGNHPSNALNSLYDPSHVLIDKVSNSLIISDQWNQRVMRWSRQEGTSSGEILVSDVYCGGLAMDHERNLYVSEPSQDIVRRYRMGDNTGTIVAGGNERGNELNQFYAPSFIFVDEKQSVYVSDGLNDRVVMWKKDATQGIVVAGGEGEGKQLNHLSSPEGVFVDPLGTVYVVEWGNERVVRWCKGANEGDVIAGVNGRGADKNQLNGPMGLAFDSKGNLYVADSVNHRVQRFSMENS